jgi:hypothetical protein
MAISVTQLSYHMQLAMRCKVWCSRDALLAIKGTVGTTLFGYARLTVCDADVSTHSASMQARLLINEARLAVHRFAPGLCHKAVPLTMAWWGQLPLEVPVLEDTTAHIENVLLTDSVTGHCIW